ncbi:hypothetical protein BZA77DRAFT_344472 [Pyronema omphalodes]|nr:hypothetical protein BZA77DRAFT_344472 [Pyronema omphalodes]
MDAFTISTGVAGFLSLALEITKILTAYIDGVKSAPEEARNLLAQVTALCHTLEQLTQFLRKDYNGNFAETSALISAVEACRDQITKLYKNIVKLEVRCEKGKISQAMERLKWPFRKQDYDSTMATVQRFTQTFQFSLTISNCELLAKSSREVMTELRAREHQMEQNLESRFTLTESLDQEMESLLQWISPLEPQTRHQDVRSKRLANIGNWFLESEIFRNWRDDSDGVNIFGCYGIPGAGKTFISSLVIDHLSGFAGSKTYVAFIYCDYREAKEQTPVNMIGGLLKQAITASKGVPTDIIETLLKKKKDQQAIEVKDAVHSLSRLLKGFDKTYICIDALDECNETDRRQLIQYLVELSSSSDDNESRPIRLFFTGRPPMENYVISHTSVEPEIPFMVKLQASTEDITAYIAHKIDEDKTIDMDDGFKKYIVEEIVSASKGMFLLPALQIETVLDEPTIRKRREALKCMPRELYDAFGITLDRIRAQKKSMSSLAMKVLKWIFLFTGPLWLEEDNFVEPQFILDCCLGLVIVDESTSTVRLVHKSLQDYFQDQYNEGLLFNEGHMEIASICMTYMSFHHLNEELRILEHGTFYRYPLLGYAIYRWGYHLRSSKTRNPEVEEMAFAFVMEKYKSLLVPRKFLTKILERFSDFTPGSEAPSLYYGELECVDYKMCTETFPLHIAASTGSPELFCRVIDSMNGDINEMDVWGNRLLTLAADMGHTSADVNTTDGIYGRTPLIWSFHDPVPWEQEDYYSYDIVKALLSQLDIDVNWRAKDGSTALSRAIECELHDAEELLRAHGAVQCYSEISTTFLSVADEVHYCQRDLECVAFGNGDKSK